MKIESTTPLPMEALGMSALPTSLRQQGAQVLGALNALLASEPQALQSDPALRRMLGRLQGITQQLDSLRGRAGRGFIGRLHKSHLKESLKGLIHQLDQRLRHHLQGLPQPLKDAGAQRYGDDFSSTLDGILSSNLSVEEKFMLLASAVSDRLDQQIEQTMGDWSKEATQSASSSSSQPGGGMGSLLSVVGTALGGPFGGMIGSLAGSTLASSSGSGGTKGSSKSEQLQMQIQLLIDRKKNLMQAISNVMAAEGRTKNAIIQNIRA
jgi:hypothetical protein